MTEFSDTDAYWVEVGELGGGLPDAALDEIKPLVRRYHNWDDRDFEVRSWITKQNVKRAFELTDELSRVLEPLIQSNNYMCFNTGGSPVSVAPLERGRNDLGLLHSVLSQDRVRFERKSTREWYGVKREQTIVRRLLEIQQRYLKTDFPLSARERRDGLQFRKFLEKCTDLSGPSLDKVLDKVIAKIVPKNKTTRRRTSITG